MASSTGKEQAVRGRLPAARRDRRPALAALAVLLILLGALGSALIAFRSGEKVTVLVAASAIPVGKEVAGSDFRTIRVASDSDPNCGDRAGCSFVPSDSLRNFIGTRAATTIPAGTVVSPGLFSRQRPIPDGSELVGVEVPSQQRTTEVPKAGDVVSLRCVAGSGDTQVSCERGEAVVSSARVIAVGEGSTSDVRNVTVLVSESDAGKVANFASSGNLALTLLPDDTKPTPDVDTAGQ